MKWVVAFPELRKNKMKIEIFLCKNKRVDIETDSNTVKKKASVHMSEFILRGHCPQSLAQ